MSTVQIPVPLQAGPRMIASPLVNGERMKQPEFHRRYEMCGPDEKWELVRGIVYMASPLRDTHSRYDGKIGLVLELYSDATPGVVGLHTATTILGAESEPQPDLGLRIEWEYGGKSRINDRDYVEGSPELLVEVAYSTRDLDMHDKRDDYRGAGVIEYLVVCVEEQEVHWFHFPSRRSIRPDRQGISRSRVFPGLWLDTAALLRLDSKHLREVLEQGLTSRAHAAFVRRLQRQHQRHGRGQTPSRE
jgi:Uma2 family endonuclease